MLTINESGPSFMQQRPPHDSCVCRRLSRTFRICSIHFVISLVSKEFSTKYVMQAFLQTYIREQKFHAHLTSSLNTDDKWANVHDPRNPQTLREGGEGGSSCLVNEPRLRKKLIIRPFRFCSPRSSWPSSEQSGWIPESAARRGGGPDRPRARPAISSNQVGFFHWGIIGFEKSPVITWASWTGKMSHLSIMK